MRIETCKHSNTAGTCYICWHELIEDRDRLAAELAGLRAQVPVAWMHETRVDVIHESVRTLLKTLSGGAGPESLHRPIDKSERYTIPLYAAPVPAQVPDDYVAAMDMLSLMFESYENGVPCNDSPDEAGASYIGQAFRLNDVDFKRIADILNKYRPVVAAAHKGGE